MAAKLSSNLRKAIWLMMTDRDFKAAVASGKFETQAEKLGLQLTPAEKQTLTKIDPRDLGDLLSKIEQDVTLMMGGSRPRPSVSLSSSTINELKKALKDAE